LKIPGARGTAGQKIELPPFFEFSFTFVFWTIFVFPENIKLILNRLQDAGRMNAIPRFTAGPL
jgi:hypothetical protein